MAVANLSLLQTLVLSQLCNLSGPVSPWWAPFAAASIIDFADGTSPDVFSREIHMRTASRAKV
ncbi:MAG: hypothetical protein VX017_08655, partial [Pseudomonadota bacterium]|nr:hypothetical protein [Pseudomonadota bacterium]